MTITAQIAKHFREVHFGGNWTFSNVQDQLKDLTWEQATTKVSSLNTITTLVFHMGYYVTIILKVLKGGPLEGNDKLSFEHPPITNRQEWEDLLKRTKDEAEECARLIELLPDNKLLLLMADEKYGTWYRNLHGLIEHTHYHLGQIALIRKLVVEKGEIQS